MLFFACFSRRRPCFQREMEKLTTTTPTPTRTPFSPESMKNYPHQAKWSGSFISLAAWRAYKVSKCTRMFLFFLENSLSCSFSLVPRGLLVFFPSVLCVHTVYWDFYLFDGQKAIVLTARNNQHDLKHFYGLSKSIETGNWNIGFTVFFLMRSIWQVYSA